MPAAPPRARSFVIGASSLALESLRVGAFVHFWPDRYSRRYERERERASSCILVFQQEGRRTRERERETERKRVGRRARGGRRATAEQRFALVKENAH